MYRATRLLAPAAVLTLLVFGAVGAGAQSPAPPPFTLPAWETDHPFADIPHPRDVFRFEPGADYRLADNARILEYFRALDAASDRVRVEQIGESVLGRPMIVAWISSAANIARLDEVRETAEQLARGRLTEEEARARAVTGKAVVWIDGGLHATEVAGAQHTPLLAYRVAGEETAEMQRIRDDVVLLLMPVMNPDGLDLVVDWTARSRGTAWEGSSPPVLYQHYTGHDNNRDWFMMTQPETRAVADVLYNRWYPQIVYNQHQTAPWPARIFIPPFTDPVNPHIPPLVVWGVNTVGNAMGKRFSEEGKPGAVSRISFDMWWNGGMRTTPYFHNMIGILTETAHRSVAPEYTPPGSLPAYIRGTFPATAPSVFYPDPWLGGWFRLRDAVEYMITGAMATLDVASELKEDWLLNTWRMGSQAVAAGEAGGPFAYVIPPEQRNPLEATSLVDILRWGGVEVHRATRAFEADGARYPAGSYVVLAGQAFRPHLMDLLEPQVYPDTRLYPGGPPDTPYDVSGWTLPIQMDVRAVRIDGPFETAALQAVDRAEPWPGRVAGDGPSWVLPARSNAAAVAVNRLLDEGASVGIATGVRRPTSASGDGGQDAEGDHGDVPVPPGSYVIRDASRARLEALASELGVPFTTLRGAGPEAGGPDAAATAGTPMGVGSAGVASLDVAPMDRPRVGLYKSWVANMDEGWTRWVMDRYGFVVDTLHDADIRSGDLSRYHAIILPDQRPDAILHGHEPGTRPASMTGGIGLEGMVRLQEYVQSGGRLIAFDGAGALLIDQLGLPVRNVVEGLPSEEFFVPGTLVRMAVDTSHALGYGMPTAAAASFVRSAAYAVTGEDGIEVVARYAETDPVLSGWALGEERLGGRGALVRVPVGAGDVVLFGFRPQFRGQPRGTFRLIFNAIHGAAAGLHRIAPPTGRAPPGPRSGTR